MLANILETLGLGFIVAAAWTIAVPVGLFFTGAFLVLIGMGLDRTSRAR
jgi:uncharacterized membrane protein